MSAPVTENDDVRRLRAHRTFDRAVELLLGHDMMKFARLWAPDGTMDFPFAVADQPSHLQGREAVVEYLSDYTAMVDVRDVRVHKIHSTGDPDTLVVEWEASGLVATIGRKYRLPYIAVITVGPDGIRSYRDYWNLALAADAFVPADRLAAGVA